MSNITTEKIIGLIKDGIEHYDELDKKSKDIGDVPYSGLVIDSMQIEAHIGRKTLRRLLQLIEAEGAQ